ncbi:unnamed protein product [Acanthoscelides obtectus]|uniref:CCHC-type domain-containing protein n=1 Tax=Acanthoscelides obtectus TaxID=200917 RepID=A0A9P0QFR7_ACAOB|nr:unnamed protein product [Acanthoscelides obtectus]CAK1688935.1 hypothetical protein AOBTE_LOCUS36960 [Acanthoscelides obtectus]
MFVKRNYGKNHGHAGNGGRGSGVSEGIRGSGVSEGARGSGVSEGRRTFRYKCHRCRKVGHKAAECPDKGKTVANSYKSEANCSDNVGLVTAECYHVEQNHKRLKWCLDSGATSHLCKDISCFSDLERRHDHLNLAK